MSTPPLTELSAAQQRAVEALRTTGVAAVPFAELFPDGELWEELSADMGEFVAEVEGRLPAMSREDRAAEFGKAFLVRRYRAKKLLLGLDNPWVRLGVSPEFLGIVNTYRGRELRIHDVDNWYTVPDPEAERSASQRWHRDGWENHIVKVFTYFNDVDGEAGPFEYVLGSPQGQKYGDLYPWDDKEVYPPDGAVEEAVDQADIRPMTGAPGTIVFCDTSGFHRGGYARSKPRILSYHTYLSDEGQQKHRRKFEIDVPDGLPPETQYALG